MTPSSGAPDLLVLEPAPRGHGREWLVHLAEHAWRCDPGLRLTFVVAPPVAERLRADPPPLPGLDIVALSEREVAMCTHRRLVVSGLARWWTMRRHLAASGARHGLFLELDHLSLPLAMRLPLGPGRSVSGILFRPSVHYDRAATATVAERLRDLRKAWLYRSMLRHPAVRQVHTLDDGFPGFARSRYRGGDKVTALVDPAFPAARPAHGDRKPAEGALANRTLADRALAERPPAGRRLFVLFGVLTERKGVLALLRALARLDAATAGGCAVIVAGEVDPAIQESVERELAAVARARPELWLHLEPRFLASGEIGALIERADVVLAPYQRFVGSSGVLMWAASRGRPVIAQEYGLVGRLVREHGLGLTADTCDPRALAAAISAAAAAVAAGAPVGTADPAKMAAFAGRATPAAFAAAVLDPVLADARRRGEAEVSCRAAAAFGGGAVPGGGHSGW